MTVKATKFTPEVLLSAPRRSAGVPNKDASLVLYTVSTYSFEDHKKTSQVRVLYVETAESRLITDEEGASEPQWLDDEDILVLVPGEKGVTKVVVGKFADFEASKYTAGTIDAPASNVKLTKFGNEEYAFSITAQAKPDGSLHNPETAPKPHTSGKLYTSLFVRHWDTYVTPNRNAIWYGTLSKSSKSDSSESSYKLSSLTNALKGTGLESPIPPFGGGDNFDISSSGIIFVAKDPNLNPATNTKCNVYLILLSTFQESEASEPIQVIVNGFDGASSSPVFSSDGKNAAFLCMRKNGYESDKNHLFVIPDIRRPNWITHFFGSDDGEGRWDRSPQSISWSKENQTLYILAEETGRVCIWSIPSTVMRAKSLPEKVLKAGTITDVRPLSSGEIFASGTSLIDNSTYYRINPMKGNLVQVISSNSRNGSAFGLSPKQVDEVWWPGAMSEIHSWVIKPSTFHPNEKYPLAYIIHGGPQGAWTDGWSTRWNPAVFAEQGYVVICPNPTGSTGYGQAFTDAIQEQWGGLPYEDIVKGFDWIEKNMSYVDTSRAVALGASYGGYMMNWIQGQPLGRKFKALVTHDGVFSMTGQLASEELYFPEHEFGGKYWENADKWLQWDPARFTANWSTPHLVIHSELDYRLTMAEGLSAFNVLQTKGVPSQFLTFPDENHWVLNPENSLLWHKVVFDWINKYAGLPRPGSTADELKQEALMRDLNDLIVS